MCISWLIAVMVPASELELALFQPSSAWPLATNRACAELFLLHTLAIVSPFILGIPSNIVHPIPVLDHTRSRPMGFVF